MPTKKLNRSWEQPGKYFAGAQCDRCGATNLFLKTEGPTRGSQIFIFLIGHFLASFVLPPKNLKPELH